MASFHKDREVARGFSNLDTLVSQIRTNVLKPDSCQENTGQEDMEMASSSFPLCPSWRGHGPEKHARACACVCVVRWGGYSMLGRLMGMTLYSGGVGKGEEGRVSWYTDVPE